MASRRKQLDKTSATSRMFWAIFKWQVYVLEGPEKIKGYFGKPLGKILDLCPTPSGFQFSVHLPHPSAIHWALFQHKSYSFFSSLKQYLVDSVICLHLSALVNSLCHCLNTISRATRQRMFCPLQELVFSPLQTLSEPQIINIEKSARLAISSRDE